MKILLFTVAMFASSVAGAQVVSSPYIVDEKGAPIKAKKIENVTGSPYLYENWASGKVKTVSGRTFKDLELKYDVIDDRVIFKNSDGSSMYFSEPIAEFELKLADGKTETFISGLPAGEKITNKSILQCVAPGKIGLYKKHSMNMIASKGYGAQNVSETYNASSSYYTLIGDKWTKISPSKKSVIALLPSKEAEISSYIKNEKIDFKQDGDLNKLFSYINTL